jgi:hypothetical protein
VTESAPVPGPTLQQSHSDSLAPSAFQANAIPELKPAAQEGDAASGFEAGVLEESVLAEGVFEEDTLGEGVLRHNHQTHGLVPDFWGPAPKATAPNAKTLKGMARHRTGASATRPQVDARDAVRLSGLCSAMVFAWWTGWLWFHEPTITVWRWLAHRWQMSAWGAATGALPTASLLFTLTITPMVTACWIFILCKRTRRAGWSSSVVLPFVLVVVAPACWLWHSFFPGYETLALVLCSVVLEMLKSQDSANAVANLKERLLGLYW